MGLVQHEGGPCGVLAAIQVIVTFIYIVHFSDLFKKSIFQTMKVVLIWL